ncbi:DUF397 domain-containing protein [Kineosporia succinea]|uniref:DUF397 domain-containing protein n=1 Tax=Kineosporia succinea TaxID=84632 RepID=A0ABT9NX52_9ACTN|nr:DUF397 domain-containing protein [Kineosporia succinea]MDP9825010.1 hypothetical protein [Kineosporia succinea]
MSNTEWHKASASDDTGQCVEVRRLGNTVLLRDTKDRSGAVLSFSPAEWQAFITGVKAAEFDTEAMQ